MSFYEETLIFDCAGETLLGVVSLPDRPSAVGVVVVVGGPQYRCGSHRQFVQLARRLASNGHVALRFDLRGMGDSTGDLVHFESASADVRAAIDALLRHRPGLKGVVLWGLCDGASAALLYIDQQPDPRVRALFLVNPWVRSAQTLARTHLKHYYLQRLGERDFWLKLLKGGVGWRAASQLVDKLRSGLLRSPQKPTRDLDYVGRMARAGASFKGPMAVALSENDYTAREFDELASGSPTWQAVMARGNVVRLDIPGADHTFSAPAARDSLEAATLTQLGRLKEVMS